MSWLLDNWQMAAKFAILGTALVALLLVFLLDMTVDVFRLFRPTDRRRGDSRRWSPDPDVVINAAFGLLTIVGTVGIVLMVLFAIRNLID
jgi:hypothetical protein